MERNNMSMKKGQTINFSMVGWVLALSLRGDPSLCSGQAPQSHNVQYTEIILQILKVKKNFLNNYVVSMQRLITSFKFDFNSSIVSP